MLESSIAISNLAVFSVIVSVDFAKHSDVSARPAKEVKNN